MRKPIPLQMPLFVAFMQQKSTKLAGSLQILLQLPRSKSTTRVCRRWLQASESVGLAAQKRRDIEIVHATVIASGRPHGGGGGDRLG